MKKIIAIAAFGSIFTVSAVQAAGSGTVNFVGTVTSQTCNAAVNGSSAPTDATVTLPTVQASSLAAVGNTAGQTAFKVDVTGCAATNPAGAGTVRAFFEKGPNVDANGRLINTASTTPATNVVLELVEGTGNSALKAGDISQNTGNFVAISGGNATLPYSVRYYATGSATAGSVASSVTYSLVYK